MPKEWILNQANMRWGLTRKNKKGKGKIIYNPEVIEEIKEEIKRLQS